MSEHIPESLIQMPVVTVEQIIRFRDAALAVEKQRDELLSALTDAVCALEVCGKDFRATEIARQAIAKHRGKQ